MARRIVTRSGREPLIANATAYLVSMGVPLDDIRSIDIHAEVGAPMMLTVELFVHGDDDLGDEPQPAEVEFQRRMMQMTIGPLRYGAQQAWREAISEDHAAAIREDLQRQAVAE